MNDLGNLGGAHRLVAKAKLLPTLAAGDFHDRPWFRRAARLLLW